MIGAAIAQARQAKGLTQEGLAERLGVTRSAVAQWEADLCDPTLSMLCTLAKALNVTPETLLGDASMSETKSAFAIRNLSVLAYANGFTLWHYKAPKESLSAISSGNYFGSASDMLTGGDMLLVNGSDGARMLAVSLADVDIVVVAPLS